MSRFINHQEMPSDDLIRCASEAAAIVRLCESAAWAIQNGGDANDLSDAIMTSLATVYDLIGVMHEALELHERGNVKPLMQEAAE